MTLGSTQPLTETSTRSISWGWQPYHHPVPLSWNLGTLTSWNPLGHSRPVTGLLYLYLLLISVRGRHPQDHSAAGRITSMKNSNENIRNRTCDLLVCSAVPQPTVPPRAPMITVMLVMKVLGYSTISKNFILHCHFSEYVLWIWATRMNKTFPCNLVSKIFVYLMVQGTEYSNCVLWGYKTAESIIWLSTSQSNLLHSLDCIVWKPSRPQINQHHNNLKSYII